MDDNEEMIIFGTLLPQFAEDEIPSKKPQTIADQIAVDANGKRRFHGAFTGGFSAGFWNTVGSLEGWKPKSFKSSRAEKAEIPSQAPTDFMDDEDMGEFGIAPHRIQTTEEFTDNKLSNKKTRISLESDGPIMGNPVKELFLAPVKGKTCVNLLRKMGWKDEAGFRGYTMKKRKRREKSELPIVVDDSVTKIYNCDMGPIQKTISNDDEYVDSSSDEEETIEFNEKKSDVRINRFGLGYVGLQKYFETQPKQQHVNLFAQLEAEDKRKKLPISGQAFGVGAFEDDDDDIYAKEDLSTYDFSLGEKSAEKNKLQPPRLKKNTSKISGVTMSSSSIKNTNKMYIIDLPVGFHPTNWSERKTRFGPMTEQNKDSLTKIKIVNLNAETRGITLLGDSKSKQIEENEIQKDEKTPKQSPSTQRIRQEYGKSLVDKITFDRFVSEKDVEKLPEPAEPVQPNVVYEVKIKRTRTHWDPSKILCQKMNVAEPITGYKKTKNKTFLFFENVANASKGRQRTELDLVESKDKEFENEIPGLATPSGSKTTKSQNKLPAVPLINELNKTNILKSGDNRQLALKPTKKTELELRADREKDKHPSEKKDLFKSIFSSSEESDDDNDDDKTSMALEKNENRQDAEEIPKKSTDLIESPIDKTETISSGSVLMIEPQMPHLNQSIIMDKIEKPTINTSDKLLSMLSDPLIFKPKSSRETKITEKCTNDTAKGDESKIETEIEPLTYGPSLPIRNIQQSSDLILKNGKNVPIDFQAENSSDEDYWVDKSEKSRKRKRKDHKHKKSKKHKRHKSKK